MVSGEGEPCRAWAAHGSCTLGTAGSMWRKDTSPPSPPECLLQTDHDQTPGGREPGRGGPWGSGPRKSSGGRGRCRPTGSWNLWLLLRLVPQPAARSADNSIPSRLFPRPWDPHGRGTPGQMEAGFGEPGKAGDALRGRFQVVWRFVNREVRR